MADRLVITKTDLAQAHDVSALIERIRRFNPTADVVVASNVQDQADRLLAHDMFDISAKTHEVRRWFAQEMNETHAHHHHQHAPIRHGEDIESFCMIFSAPLDWTVFGVQHLVHPPVHMARWPDNDRRSKIVFITKGVQPGRLRRSLAAYMARHQQAFA